MKKLVANPNLLEVEVPVDPVPASSTVPTSSTVPASSTPLVMGSNKEMSESLTAVTEQSVTESDEIILNVDDFLFIIGTAAISFPDQMALQMLENVLNEKQLQLFNFVYEEDGTLGKNEYYPQWKMPKDKTKLLLALTNVSGHAEDFEK